MANSTSYTLEQYQTLCAAIASGTKEVVYSDKKVVYQTTQNMLAVKHQMEVELCLTENPTDYKGGRRIGNFCR